MLVVRRRKMRRFISKLWQSCNFNPKKYRFTTISTITIKLFFSICLTILPLPICKQTRLSNTSKSIKLC